MSVIVVKLLKRASGLEGFAIQVRHSKLLFSIWHHRTRHLGPVQLGERDSPFGPTKYLSPSSLSIAHWTLRSLLFEKH